MSAATVPSAETEQLWGQQGDPQDLLLLLHWESPHFFHRLLVQCHQPAAQNPFAENCENLFKNHWTTGQRTFSSVWTADPQNSEENNSGLLPCSVPRVWVAPLRAPVTSSRLQDTEEENDLCPEGYSTPQFTDLNTHLIPPSVHSVHLNFAHLYCLSLHCHVYRDSFILLYLFILWNNCLCVLFNCPSGTNKVLLNWIDRISQQMLQQTMHK